MFDKKSQSQNATLNRYTKQVAECSALNDSDTTYKAKVSCLNIIESSFDGQVFEYIKHSNILAVICQWQKEGASNKTINNRLAPMRQVFKYACADGVFDIDPMMEITNLKTPKAVVNTNAQENIDPFSQEEVNLMLNYHTPGNGGSLAILLMIYTGLRACEVTTFCMESLDLEAGTYKVDITKPADRYKCTKTETSSRSISLSKYVQELLKQHIDALDTLNTYEIDVVLQDNRTVVKRKFTPILPRHCGIEAHYKHTKDLDQSFYRHFLKKLNIRSRGIHQCRKTFACHAVSDNLSTKWISEQLGHTDTKVLESHYAKWIKTDNEIAPEERLSQRFSPATASPIATVTDPKQALKVPVAWHKKLINSFSNMFKRAA
ncbi:tyrosine-type recombinase/integrase [Vibrio breoganii]|uniref:Tyrosine-type recombinase/integrase n=1 Tax=Vibrio breoganii TaxID=553239 RepID=A0ABX1UBS1_9VIBR|nr:site-specific integrase [Vibrio breoganii]NMO75406.1 tyrosine-type recombinase/integrase [Vibrio breoganii]NMR71949.1 tyrosine-type recombinase/integrase [Vibrio breoganii]PML92186.1 hypothetical protein BCT67_00285 [Vibrio breoganii]